ncbi:cadmium-translocating P-type ATPase [Arthrobacter sp. zg-Y20]|uniref:heavy metal translocating P-type ATPase n=1 Tax=unclassified Arthrobacter TaxID=235627 RepID=UPI001D1482A2|nr:MULTISPECIES: heavy metal translocating P-type ATPase [unclassified Arthrobacter]MCC3275288.1 cadmium-translocating P-type ATPase [Arthrobacter sp. zg-Y20]MDK1315446.1 heavy metal translocating P-type ATPase [Arthrobacter sp. zg.Y20]WIB05863.1 heavy metal translocating P-type ATPase [Arthrobacter sp. zg-Y20]
MVTVRMNRSRTLIRRYPLVVATVLVGVAFLVLQAAGAGTAADWTGGVYACAVAAKTGAGMIRDIRAGRYGLDILAVIAILSTVVVGEYLAALIIVLMLTGGEALEDYAAGRARRELDALLTRAPQQAHRFPGGNTQRGAVDVPATDVVPGDLLLIRPAEVVPVDGILVSSAADFDESSLTGESLPVGRHAGDPVMSGSVNGARAVLLQATATTTDSQYQRIVALVAEAAESKAPVVRLADRFAVPFTVVSLLIASLAWALSGDPVRFAEVLVLATPCPLLIAAPVAFLGGMSRSARTGIIVKGGAVLEQLAKAGTAAFDKTGTLTHGHPELVEVRPQPGFSAEDVLALAASAEQYSSHVLAAAVQQAAAVRGLEPHSAADARETATNGVEAVLDGHSVRVGKERFVAETAPDTRPADLQPGQMVVYIGVDGHFAGTLIMSDAVRDNAAATLHRLAELGIGRTVMLTGDSAATAEAVAAGLGITDVRAGLLPAGKVDAVRTLAPRPVIMVGDGVNDAPVLAVADVGIAMGARGSTAASESADVVLVADDISKVADAVQIGRRTMRVALGSIWLGIALSLALMLTAAFGFIPAVAGALTQELVDLAAILNALRALHGGRQLPGTARETPSAADSVAAARPKPVPRAG